MSERKLNVAVVGLGFGVEFLPLYQRHPQTQLYAICQRTQEMLDQVGNAFGVEKRCTKFEQVLRDPEVDVIHLNTPVHLHATQAIAALKAGKSVACAPPAAISIEECKMLARAIDKTKMTFMMMEPSVYTREFLFVEALRDEGKLGRIQFLRGAYLQNMEGGASYWEGLPPMLQATRAVGPCLGIVRGEAELVTGLGSGRVSESVLGKSGSPFCFETALGRIRHQDLSFEISRFQFDAARQPIESFDLYATGMSFEWRRAEGEEPILHHGGAQTSVASVPDYAEFLPEPIRPFTRPLPPEMSQEPGLAMVRGGLHGGALPHLVDELVQSILEDRPPFPNPHQALNWTMVGLCAHESALRDGEPVRIPDFRG